MRKFPTNIAAIALAACVTSATASADTLGVYLGGGVWQNSYSGDIGLDNRPATLGELGLDDKQNTFFFVALEHPIPVIPNIKLAISDMTTDGNATITREIIIDDDFTIQANADTSTEIDLSHTDVTLYWELLDNYVSLDIGLTARTFDGFASIAYTVDDGMGGTIQDSDNEDISGTLPMLYGKVQIDLPLSGWYVGAHFNALSFEDSSITDYEAKVGYMSSGLGLDVGFELGYREMSLVVEETDELNVDASVDGAFGALIIHF